MNKSLSISALATTLAVLLGASPANATTYYWDTTTTSTWNTGASWSNNPTSGGTTGTVPSAGDSAVFNQSGVNGATTANLGGTISIAGITFVNTSTTLLQGGGTASTLTIGATGITENALAGAVTIGGTTTNAVNINLNGSQSWTNNSSTGALTVTNNVSNNSTTTPAVLTLAGSGTSGITINGNITDNGAGTIAVTNSAGTNVLTGTNTYSGTTTVNGGTLKVQGSGALSANSAISLGSGTLAVLNNGAGSSGTISLGNNITLNSATTTDTISVANNGSNTGNTVAFGALSMGGAGVANVITVNFTGANGYLESFSSLSLAGAGGQTTTLNPTTTSVTITGNVTNPQTTVTTNHYDTLVLSGTSSGNAINGIISDATGATGPQAGDTNITMSGTGAWTLAGANTYHGNTVVSAGTLNLAGTGASLANTAISTSGAGVFNEASNGSISGAASVVTAGTGTSILAGTNSYTGATTVGTGTTLSLTGSLTGATAITNSGTFNESSTGVIGSAAATFTNTIGTATLSGANTYTGATTVTAGTLQLNGANGALALSGTAVALNGGSFILDNTGASSNNNNRIADTQAFSFAGGNFVYKGSDQTSTNSTETIGALSGAGNSTLTVSFGGTNGATLTTASFTHAAGNATDLVNGVNLGKNNTDTTSFARLISTTAPTLTGTSTAVATGAGTVKNLKIVPFLVGESSSGLGTATGTANSFVTYVAGSGYRSLDTTNEFTNNAITSGNNTYITSATAASANTSINSLVINGGDLSINDGVTVTNTSGALLFASNNSIKPTGTTGIYTGAAENQITVNSGVTGTISAIINGTQALTKSGAGTLVLSGANTFSGTTTTNTGTLNLSNALALQNSTLQYNAGSSLVFDQSVTGNAFSLGGLAGTQNITLANNAGTPAPIALTVGGNNATTTYGGVLSGSGSLIKNGTGTLNVSLNQTYTGGLTINSGTVSAANSITALGASGTLTLGQSGSANSASYNAFGFNNPITVNPGVAGTPGAALRQITPNTGSSFTIGGPISLVGGATMNFNLSSATYTLPGGVSGTGNIVTSGTSGKGAGITFNTVSFNPTGLFENLNPGGGTALFNSVIGTNVTGLTENTSTSKIVLTGANTFFGDTTITNGTVNLQNTLALQNSVVVTNSTAGSLTFGTSGAVGLASATLGGLSGNGNVALNDTLTVPGAVALTIGNSNALVNSTNSITGAAFTNTLNPVYSGILSNGTSASPASVTKVGTNTQTFSSGANTYTGATTITGGILSITTVAAGGTASDIGQSTNSASNLVLDGGTLQYLGATAGSTDRLFQIGLSTDTGAATGTIDSSSVSGTNTLSFTNAGAVTYGKVNQADNLTLTGSNTGTNTLAPSIGDNGTGAVSVTKAGSGTWALTNANTYSGGTTVNAGILTSAVTGGFGAGNVTVAPTGTLLANSATLNTTGSIASTALVTVNNNAAAIGTVNFNGATPTIGGLSGNGKAVLNNASGTALTVGSTNNLSSTFGGVISEGTAGMGSLVKAGTGTLTLSNANTYTGATSINAGNLRVTGSTSTGAVTVGNNSATSATLSGSGTVGGNVTTSTTGSNVAYLAPGVNSTGTLGNFGGAGTLTIGGNLTIGAGTVLDYDLAGTNTTGGGVNDYISVGGGLALTMSAGSTTFDFTGSTPTTTGSYTVINAGSGITGFSPADFVALGLPTGTTATFTTSGGNLQVSFSTMLAAGYFNGNTTSNLNSASAYDTTQSGTAVAGSAPISTTDIYFSNNNNTVNTGTITGAALSVKSITFGSGTGVNSGMTVSSDNNTTDNLTIANGITVLAGAGNDTISAPVALGASQTWANGSSGALAVTGGVTGTANLALQANSTGAINISGGSVNNVGTFTNSGTGSGTTTISSVIGTNVTGVTQNSSTSNLVLTGANTYTGGTTVSAGTLYANNSTSSTGTGAVAVSSGGTLAGGGTVSGAVTLTTTTTTATLSSGASQTAYAASGAPTGSGAGSGLVNGTGTGGGLTLSSSLTVGGGSTLTFALGSNVNGSGGFSVSNPNTDSSYLTVDGTGDIFSTTTNSAKDNIDLVDLTANETFGDNTLTLRYQGAYLLMVASSAADFGNLVTTTDGGVTTSEGGTGYVLGIATGTMTGGNYNYVGFNIEVQNIGGTQISNSTNNYQNLQLYLNGAELEVVPEPGTWALMLGGLAVLIFIQRRKNRSN